jgi:Mrp family chromosome partitioning ATPase
VIENWLQPIEQIAVSVMINRMSILGFTSPSPRSGVTTISRMLAEILARSGVCSLVVDLSRPIEHTDMVMDKDELWQRIVQNEGGFHMLFAAPSSVSKSRFNNVSWLRQCLNKELAGYGAIVLDLPPLVPDRADLINPVAAAAACDAVLMVCARGRVTRPQLKEAVELLRPAQVNLVGTILNDIDYALPGEEIARAARRLSWVAPNISRWIERRLLGSEMPR